MSIAAPEPKANMGQPIPRYDAFAKVTGNATYAADVPLTNPLYAYLVTSSIAKGTRRWLRPCRCEGCPWRCRDRHA